jgi:hypothetical protein
MNEHELGLLEFHANAKLKKQGNVDQDNRLLGFLYCLKLITSSNRIQSERIASAYIEELTESSRTQLHLFVETEK